MKRLAKVLRAVSWVFLGPAFVLMYPGMVLQDTADDLEDLKGMRWL